MFIYSSIEGHSGGSHSLAVVNNAPMDMCSQVFVNISLGWNCPAIWKFRV